MARLILSAGEVQALYDKLESIEKTIKRDQINIQDPVLTTEQVMKYLNVSRRTLQSWRDNNVIRYSAVANKFFYRLSDINEMLEKHIINPEIQ
jgi:excisionase family DNA binding protein